MNNINSIDTVQYEKAEEINVDKFQNLMKLISVLLKVSWLLAYEFLLLIVSFLRPPKPDKIAGQLCLITGGANGLGRCLAFKFAEQNCNIAIVDVLDPEPTVKEIVEKFGVKCRGFKCDISDNDALEKLKLDVEALMGNVDILVNNAGLLFMGTLENSTFESISKCVAVNLVSHFTTVKLFLPEMIKRKNGKIVAISSMLARMTLPMSSVYTATKFGVDGFMESLFDDLCLDGNEEFVRLTTVFPYFINTRKELGKMMDEMDDFIPRMTPEYVASKIVKGVLVQKRKIFVTPFLPQVLTQQFPDRIIKYLKTSTTKTKEYKQKHFQ